MSKKVPQVFVFFIIIALAVSAIVLFNRSVLENQFKQVELVMSLDELRELAYQEGYKEDELLKEIKIAGINSIAIHEDSLDKLSLSGDILYFSNREFNKFQFFLKTLNLIDKIQLSGGESYIVFKNEKEYIRIKDYLQRQLGKNTIKDYSFLTFRSLKVKGSEEKLEALGLGFSREDIQLVKDIGFEVILRFKNFSQIGKEDIDFKFEESNEAGNISGIIFDGESVLGYPSKENMFLTAELLRTKKYPFGMIEFANQEGIKTIAHSASELAVKVHSITKEEMEIISTQKALERWIRAAKERKVRIFYIKPFLNEELNLLEENTSYIKNIKDNLNDCGFSTGKASLFNPYQESNIFILILILGVISGGIILLKNIFNLKKIQNYALLVLGILFSIAFLLLGKEILLIKLFALLSALIFPTLAIISNEKYFLGDSFYCETKSTKKTYQENSGYFIMIKIVLLGFFRIIFVTLSGALLIAALLSSGKFMLGIEQFSGIKISYLLPLLLVLGIMWLKQNEGKLLILETIKKPILIEHVIILAFFAVFLVIYVARSGNFSFLPVLGIEEKIRVFLEKILIARPRNKEFLIGYPALLLAISMNYLKIKEFKIPIIIIGTIGPVTLINTFCHIHTPFLFSLLRTFNGVWLGVLIGLFVISIFYFTVKIFRKTISNEKN